ncbi:MAG: flagellar protein [Eubacterium sp.]|jgi:flagellar operon protein|nr:flagellar protein [Eubacterium sp.]
MNRVKGVNGSFPSIEQVAGQYLNTPVQNRTKQRGASFQEILAQKTAEQNPLKFSKHASQRLENRNISLTKEQSERLENGVDRAREKGINDSLVIVDSLAFIVNVPNKTVVTAMDQAETNDNIFTNIDGAVII